LRDVTLFTDGEREGASFHELLGGTEEVRRLVGTAPIAGEVRGIDATPYGAERYTVEGALWVGDAASLLDPISAHGVHKAMDGALVAAAVVRTILERPSSAADARLFYNEREESLVKLTRARVRRLYRQETRFAAETFWALRSRGTDEDDALATTASVRSRPPLRFEMSLGASAGVAVAKAPVLEDDFVVRRDVLIAPSRRPVRYFRDICLPELFAQAIQAPSVGDAVRRTGMGRAQSYAAIEWLYHQGFLEVRDSPGS
jgi:hypothetical protein